MSLSLDYFRRMGSPVAALATAAGGPVSVIRISGRDLSCVEALFDSRLPTGGTFQLKKIYGENKKLIDHGVVLFFASPSSFTGEDVVEIQVHGVHSLVDEIFVQLKKLGIEKAMPGEFSFRAVINEKMTLEQAEALNFMLKSDSLSVEKSCRLLGIRKISNEVESLIKTLIEDLQRSRGRIEAAIDFPEAEIEQSREIDSAKVILEDALITLLRFQNAYRNFRQSMDLPLVGIVGSPNAGKSTLLNLLSGGQKALVSSLPGTTRDLVEVDICLESGKKIRLVDTAGIRDLGSVDEIEGHESLEWAGIQRALEAIEDCSLLIWVKSLIGADESDQLSKKIQELGLPFLVIYSHKDLVSAGDPERSFCFLSSEKGQIFDYVSRGLDELLQNKLASAGESSHILWLSERQSKELHRVEGFVRSALLSLEGLRPFELVGDDLREAERALLAVLGRDLGEEYIGQIFSQFCLGK